MSVSRCPECGATEDERCSSWCRWDDQMRDPVERFERLRQERTVRDPLAVAKLPFP